MGRSQKETITSGRPSIPHYPASSSHHIPGFPSNPSYCQLPSSPLPGVGGTQTVAGEDIEISTQSLHILIQLGCTSKQEEPAMGLSYNVYLNSDKIFGCKNCKTHLASHDSIISRVCFLIPFAFSSVFTTSPTPLIPFPHYPSNLQLITHRCHLKKSYI